MVLDIWSLTKAPLTGASLSYWCPGSPSPFHPFSRAGGHLCRSQEHCPRLACLVHWLRSITLTHVGLEAKQQTRVPQEASPPPDFFLESSPEPQDCGCLSTGLNVLTCSLTQGLGSEEEKIPQLLSSLHKPGGVEKFRLITSPSYLTGLCSLRFQDQDHQASVN